MTLIERIKSRSILNRILAKKDNMELLHKEITDTILKSFYKVYNELGFGFLEKVYENALFLELSAMGMSCEKQKQITVFYNG